MRRESISAEGTLMGSIQHTQIGSHSGGSKTRRTHHPTSNFARSAEAARHKLRKGQSGARHFGNAHTHSHPQKSTTPKRRHLTSFYDSNPWLKHKFVNRTSNAVKYQFQTSAGQNDLKIPKQVVLTGPYGKFSVFLHRRNDTMDSFGITPDLQVLYFNNSACRPYLAQNNPDMVKYFDREKHGSYRGDICRTAVLAKEGGFYLDLDMLIRTADAFKDHDKKIEAAIEEANGESCLATDNYAGRTAFHNNGEVLIHNSRADAATRLLNKMHKPQPQNTGSPMNEAERKPEKKLTNHAPFVRVKEHTTTTHNMRTATNFSESIFLDTISAILM